MQVVDNKNLFCQIICKISDQIISWDKKHVLSIFQANITSSNNNEEASQNNTKEAYYKQNGAMAISNLSGLVTPEKM